MQGGTALANIQLAKNLLQLRQEHHYTQKQLGDKLNITHQAYSYYETGHRDPNIDMLTKLSALYGFSIEQLLTVPCSIKNSFAKESANTYHTGLIIIHIGYDGVNLSHRLLCRGSYQTDCLCCRFV